MAGRQGAAPFRKTRPTSKFSNKSGLPAVIPISATARIAHWLLLLIAQKACRAAVGFFDEGP